MARLASIAARTWMAAVALLLLGGLVQCVIVARTTLPCLDSVRLISLAQRFEASPLSALRTAEEQPLYPACVAGVRATLRYVRQPRPGDWVLAAQITAGLFAALSVVPVYLIGFLLAGRTPALIAGLLWVFLPEAAWLGGYALADSLHLALLAAAMAAALAYLRPVATADRRSHWLLLSGLAAGVAVMARAEVLVLLPVVGVVVLVSTLPQLPRRPATGEGSFARAAVSPRRALLHAAVGVAALGIGFALPVASYMLLAGVNGVPSIAARLLGRPDPAYAAASRTDESSAEVVKHPLPRLSDGSPLTLSAKDATQSIRADGAFEAIGRGVEHLGRVYGYWLIPFVVWGALTWPKRHANGRLTAAEWLPGVFYVAYLVAIVAFILRERYAEPRHFLPLVVASIACASVGLGQAARAIGSLAARLRPALVRAFTPAQATAILALLIIALMAPRTFRSLHISLSPHREAGQWLLANAPRGARVVDTRGWTGLQTDLPTFSLDHTPTLLERRGPLFFVVERQEMRIDSPRGASLRHLLQSLGRPVAAFPTRRESDAGHTEIAVEVYRWAPRDVSRVAAADAIEGR